MELNIEESYCIHNCVDLLFPYKKVPASHRSISFIYKIQGRYKKVWKSLGEIFVKIRGKRKFRIPERKCVHGSSIVCSPGN